MTEKGEMKRKVSRKGISALLQLRARLSNVLAYFLASIFNDTKFNLLTSSEHVIDIVAIVEARLRACIDLRYYLSC